MSGHGPKKNDRNWMIAIKLYRISNFPIKQTTLQEIFEIVLKHCALVLTFVIIINGNDKDSNVSIEVIRP